MKKILLLALTGSMICAMFEEALKKNLDNALNDLANKTAQDETMYNWAITNLKSSLEHNSPIYNMVLADALRKYGLLDKDERPLAGIKDVLTNTLQLIETKRRKEEARAQRKEVRARLKSLLQQNADEALARKLAAEDLPGTQQFKGDEALAQRIAQEELANLASMKTPQQKVKEITAIRGLSESAFQKLRKAVGTEDIVYINNPIDQDILKKYGFTNPAFPNQISSIQVGLYSKAIDSVLQRGYSGS